MVTTVSYTHLDVYKRQMQEVGEVQKDVSERMQRTYDIANRLDEQIKTNKYSIQ